jgi:hypothetical protein
MNAIYVICFGFAKLLRLASSITASKGADVELSHIIVYVSSVVILVVTSIFANKQKYLTIVCSITFFFVSFVVRYS